MNHQPKPPQEFDLNNFPIDERINKLIEIDDLETLKGIFDSILRMKHMDLISTYILKLIGLSSKNFESIAILNRIRNIDTVDPIIALYLKYIELSQNGAPYEQTKDITILLIKWIEKLPRSLPLDEIYSVIIDNSLSYFSDEFPSLIDKLNAKNENLKLTKNLLLTLVKQSIPPRYSSWLISNIFDFFDDDTNLIQKIIEILISQLENSSDQQVNALFMIYYAFIYESNFFRLSDSNFGFTQNFTITYNDLEFSLDCSFHSFNTTTRLYSVISEKLNIKINSFVIKMVDGMNEITIQYNTPLQAINMRPLQTIKLNIIDLSDDVLSNVSEPIKNAQAIEPVFLQLFESHIDSIWRLLEDERFQEFAFEMILLYEQYQGYEEHEKINESLFSFFDNLRSNCRLQSVLLGDCSDPIEFSFSRRIFPTAVKVFSSHKMEQNDELNEKVESIIQFLIEKKYDHVSLATICTSLLRLNMKFPIHLKILKEGLIESKYQLIRDVIMKIVLVTESERDVFMGLIQTALMKSNRNHVRQFFECVKQLNMPPETFIPFYQMIDQLEFSHYKDPDEAFICLLDLIPANELTINLTIDRLFSPPTCCNIAQPFVHTIESWTAALKFLMSPIAVSKLNHFLANLQIPWESDYSLSCDFTNKGRNGIYNLGMTCYVNALLQVFNVIKPFSLGLISYDSSQLTQFEIELRNILAQLRFVRETVISIESFVDTIPNFENVQQDAIEFMEEAFIRRMNHSITDVFHGQRIESICSKSDDQILSETTVDFYILSLPIPIRTEGFSKLDQAFERYFADEPIEEYSIADSGNERVEAYHHKSIVKWPDCLALQLERWDYSERAGRSKLVDCFGFPIQINPNELNCSKGTVKCDFIYSLVGVVIHQGTADQGHYYAVVEGDDREWYLCNDKLIDYFDIKELPDFAFGGSESSSSLDEEISTAYLLFYCRQDMPPTDVKIPTDLEESLNLINSTSWPQTIFRNHNFLNYVHDLFENELKPKGKSKITFNKDLLYLGFHAFFKIAMCKEDTFNDWYEFLQKLLFSSKSDNQIMNAHAFFDYIDEHVGKSLQQIFNRSENIANILTKIISNAMHIADNSLRPLDIIMSNIDIKSGKKQVLTFAFELIQMVCCESKVDWNNEIPSIQSIFQYFLTPISKDIYKLIANIHSSALNFLLGIYADLYSKSNDDDDSSSSSSSLNKAISNVFIMNNLNVIANSLEKCSNFDKLMRIYQKRKPDVFFNMKEATPQTTSILSKFFTRSKLINFEDNDESQSSFLTFQYNITCFSNLMFSNEDRVRRSYTEKLKAFIEPNPSVANFLTQKIIVHHFNQANCQNIFKLALQGQFKNDENDNELCYALQNEVVEDGLNGGPSIPQPSEDSELAIIPIVLGFLNKFVKIIEQGNENLTVEYTDLLAVLSRSYPLSLGVYSNVISTALQLASIEKVKLNLIEVLRNIIASDQIACFQIVNNACFNAAERILSSDVVSNPSVEILAVLYKQASGTKLLAKCTDYYLDHRIDLHGQMLINLLLPPYSLKPPLFEIRNKKPSNILQVIIATSLLSAWKGMIDDNHESLNELRIYIKEALNLAKPSDLYLLSKPIMVAVKNVMEENNM